MIEWVLLAYRIPRTPSSPRIAVWRKLERLGVARLGDGLVALPADARTREQFDWIAEEIGEAGGTATIWVATAGGAAQEQAVAQAMRQARAEEYRAVIAQAEAAAGGGEGERRRTAKRLQAELRRIDRRDFFPPEEREAARRAVRALSRTAGAGTGGTTWGGHTTGDGDPAGGDHTAGRGGRGTDGERATAASAAGEETR
ncbi:Chromate resistance protein ChrB [Bailinhaonella thermotolerans]|uniref:Chromate resistance protein ChrB n=1 Tax=Bailinhaonella thermotolerans TaxID=1070861 RepID=UPI00192A67DF|nr:Chromate resistance protein ChrB [Bailinhaonella thermotolerans]